jgi:hypothetical protein
MRIVSTQNGVASAADIKKVIEGGVPGTSMKPLADLETHELDQLVNVVSQMRRDGIREQFITFLTESEEDIDEEEVREFVDTRSRPGLPVVVPTIPAASDAAIVRGKELYVEHICHSCHGDTGIGDVLTPLFDDQGRPAFPRDLAHELFKGGNLGASVYVRIMIGMPGSPHPANTSMPSADLVTLTQYCLSLGTEDKLELTNHQRAIRASSRPAIETP